MPRVPVFPTSAVAARYYLQRGFSPLPLRPRAKRPTLEDWPTFRVSEAEIPEHFIDGGNIGILLGDPSNGLVDVDLDSLEARTLAPEFLPPTEMRHGRPGCPGGHRWYRVTTPVPTERFQDARDADGTTLVELRSTGAQTMVPPSTHPSGEPVDWEALGEPAAVDAAHLRDAVRNLAIAALLARHWPGQGARHDAALAAAGFLLRAGLATDLVAHIIEAAARCADDEEAEARGRDVSDTADTLRVGEPATGGPRLETLLAGDGAAVMRTLRRWLPAGPGDGATTSNGPGRQSSRSLTQKEMLVQVAGEAELFHSPDGDVTWATITINDHRETWPIRSRAFRSWVTKEFYQRTATAPGTQALTEALALTEARARYDGPAVPVALRLAAYEGRIYLDLANEAWEAVEITPNGWQIVSNPPVNFRRTRGMLALPHPEPGGSLTDLHRFVNVGAATDAGWRLLVGSILGAIRPRGPYFVLVLHGHHGSAKSTMSRVIRELIDPNIAALRAEPKDLRDFVITASNGWIVPLDNLSHLPPWLSDAICRLSTGGGFSTRELYTDADETIFDLQRPVILNGIEEIVTRPDLLDRAVILHLPEIAATARRAEKDFWSDFHGARPRILGALLDSVSCALREQDNVACPSLPRMADAAIWVAAAESTLGWGPGDFIASYTDNRAEANVLALEASPLTYPLRQVIGNCEWSGTASGLLELLNHRADPEIRRMPGWPKTPKSLTNALRRLVPNLRGIGIEVIFEPRQNDARPIRLRRRPAEATSSGGSVTNVTSVTNRPDDYQSDAGDRGDGPARESGMSTNEQRPSGPRDPLRPPRTPVTD